jgi:hypothetical protein
LLWLSHKSSLFSSKGALLIVLLSIPD